MQHIAQIDDHRQSDRPDEVPDASPGVPCAGGVCAAIATSLLDRAGHEVVLIDDEYAADVKDVTGARTRLGKG